MKKPLKVIIPAAILGAVTFGGVILASSATRWKVRTADGKSPVRGEFTLEQNATADFNLYHADAEIGVGNAEYTVTWESSNEDVLWIDSVTGEAKADKMGLMPKPEGYAVVTVTAVAKADGKTVKREYTVHVKPGSKQLVTTLSGVNEGASLQPGVEYSLISRTYDRKDNDLKLAENQLFCSYSSDTLSIANGKFTALERGTYRIVTIGYATEADLAAGVNPVLRDVLEVFVYAEPTSTPTPAPTATLTPVPTSTPTPEPTDTPTPEPTDTPTPEPTDTPTPEPTDTPTPDPV